MNGKQVGDSQENKFTFSEGFALWLQREGISLFTSTYQAGKILAIGSLDDKVWLRQYPFKQCMGFYENNGAMIATTANRILSLTHLKGDTQRAPFDLDNDRVYYPRMAWVTGDLKVHDVVMTKDDAIVFVNTAFDCLATVDPSYSFRPLWQPEFLKGSKAAHSRDCAHLNGLCLQDGQPTFVTALGKSTESGGWREHKRAGGLLFDIRRGELINQTLSMPHSPRWYRDRLWLLNSGSGHFGSINANTGAFEAMTFCPGFARGLTFHQDWAIVTLSNMRRYKGFDGLVLGEQLDAMNMEPVCGALVINITTGKVEHWMSIEGKIREFYDVSVIADCLRPTIIGMEETMTKDIVLAPDLNAYEKLPDQLEYRL